MNGWFGFAIGEGGSEDKKGTLFQNWISYKFPIEII